ncbi:hypothetical protein VTG60DRAFT_6528 [Thermothelomyces hinnuleus]
MESDALCNSVVTLSSAADSSGSTAPAPTSCPGCGFPFAADLLPLCVAAAAAAAAAAAFFFLASFRRRTRARMPNAKAPTTSWLIKACTSPLSLRGRSRLLLPLLAEDGSLVLVRLDLGWALRDRVSDCACRSLSFLRVYERTARPTCCRISGGSFEPSNLDEALGERRELAILLCLGS